MDRVTEIIDFRFFFYVNRTMVHSKSGEVGYRPTFFQVRFWHDVCLQDRFDSLNFPIASIFLHILSRNYLILVLCMY